ncbi:hypothetical protein [Spartinivicinus ruber]|uniref:hypothetical protein n=1 Tax=Spartinivicinus ruber TaxID=2683272 RepID=UPI0013D80967|nr:hypothetical protein [Spartinivicinus ruber]
MSQSLPTPAQLDNVMGKANGARQALVELIDVLESLELVATADGYKRQLMDLDKQQIKLAGLVARCREAGQITVDDYK